MPKLLRYRPPTRMLVRVTGTNYYLHRCQKYDIKKHDRRVATLRDTDVLEEIIFGKELQKRRKIFNFHKFHPFYTVSCQQYVIPLWYSTAHLLLYVAIRNEKVIAMLPRVNSVRRP